MVRNIGGLKLLTSAEFAHALGVTHSCVRKWLLERRVARVKLGRLVRIPAEELDRLISQGHHPAEPEACLMRRSRS
jgi:excisionase family DNA binding protein